jgi:hypothetical protein
MGIVIADVGGTHTSITYDSNNVDRIAKNDLMMRRKGDDFFLHNENNRLYLKFNPDGVTTPAHVAVVAEGTLTASTILTTETITIGSTVYRFMATTAQAYDVDLGSSDADALDNLKEAINASGTGDGSDYHAGTLIHPDVTATTNGATTQVVEAKVAGTDGNDIVTTDTGGGSSLTWGAVTLVGGLKEADVLETALHGILFE